MRRFVVDPSTLASATIGRPDAPPALLVDALGRGVFEAVICPNLIDELERALRQPYFRARVDPERAREAIEAIESVAIPFDDPIDPPRLVRDPDDDYLVALAKDSHAEAIVSSDHDLLENPAITPPPIDARAACERLGITPPSR